MSLTVYIASLATISGNLQYPKLGGFIQHPCDNQALRLSWVPHLKQESDAQQVLPCCAQVS